MAPWHSVPEVEPIRWPGLGDDGRPPPHWRDSWRSCSVGDALDRVLPPVSFHLLLLQRQQPAVLISSNLRLQPGKPPGWCSAERGAQRPKGAAPPRTEAARGRLSLRTGPPGKSTGDGNRHPLLVFPAGRAAGPAVRPPRWCLFACIPFQDFVLGAFGC